MIQRLRRAGTAVALTGTVLAGTLVATGGAAQASACYKEVTPDFRNGVLSATHYEWCHEPPIWKKRPLRVTIKRFHPESRDDKGQTIPEHWVVVASGLGTATYTCQGRSTNVFWIENEPLANYACY
jgi:hypothetical protein